MTTGTEYRLDQRTQRLLKALVEQHIRDGAPVGSRTLSRASDLHLSPATIRNTMADLEEMGLIQAPHASAGRVPTVHGYRVFVDSLVTMQPLDAAQVGRLENGLSDAPEQQDSQQLIRTASGLLSGVTRLASVVMTPRPEKTLLRQIEFLPLSDNRVLAILVINEKEVQNRIIQSDREWAQSELWQIANLLNETFAGRDLVSIRDQIVKELDHVREEVNRSMATAIQMAQSAFEPRASTRSGSDCVIAGETNLMDYAELREMARLKQMFAAFDHKRDLLHLLERCIHADGVQIFIGEESGYSIFEECSVITAPYAANNEVMGVLGVIGPTRIAYDRVIPIVDMTAKLLGAALSLAP